MAPKKAPLQFSSHEGSTSFSLTPTQFQKLEGALGGEITDEHRQTLIQTVERFVLDRSAERNQEGWDDVEQLLKPWNAVVQALDSLTGNNSRWSIASHTLKELLDEGFSSYQTSLADAIYINEHKLSDLNLPGQVSLRLSKDVLRRIAHDLALTVRHARSKIVESAERSLDGGLVPPDAEQLLFIRLAKWSRAQGYRYGPQASPKKDGSGEEPSQFAYFVAALMKMIDREYHYDRRTTKPTAIADRIKTAREAVRAYDKRK